MSADGDPRRRSDDCVSYREMVEYVGNAVTEFHAIRAESLIRVSVELEKIEASFDKHQEWHRVVLERMLEAGRNNRLALASIIVGALGVVVAIGAILVAAR